MSSGSSKQATNKQEVSHTSQAYKLLSWMHAKLIIVPYSPSYTELLAPIWSFSPEIEIAKDKLRSRFWAKLRLRCRKCVCKCMHAFPGESAHKRFPSSRRAEYTTNVVINPASSRGNRQSATPRERVLSRREKIPATWKRKQRGGNATNEGGGHWVGNTR